MRRVNLSHNNDLPGTDAHRGQNSRMLRDETMAIDIGCPCGQRLRVRENLLGKRVQCPACGRILRAPDEEDVPTECEEPRVVTPGRRRKRRRRRQREDGAFPLAGLFTWLEENLKLLMFLAVVAAAIGGLIYFLAPGPAYQILEVRAVDGYLAVDGVRPKRKGFSTTGPAEQGKGDLKLGGNGKVVAIRDNPEGQFLLIRLRIRGQFLESKGRVQQGTVSVNEQDLQLSGTNPVHPLLLTTSFPEKAEVDIWQARNAQLILPPDEQASHGIYPPGQRTSNVKPRVDKEGLVEAAEGQAEYKGPAGMQVQNLYAGSLLTVTCDPQSVIWVAEPQVLGMVDLFNNLEVTCLFPRPQDGGITLQIHDGPRVPVK